MNEFIRELSEQITKDFENDQKLAMASLKIMVCGSYKDECDKEIVNEITFSLRRKGFYGCFTMNDVPGPEGIPFNIKFENIWQQMKKGSNIPMFILFAGKSASISTGLNSEIQDVVNDKSKVECAYLITLPDVELTHYAKSLANTHIVNNKQEAIEKAVSLTEAKMHQIINFLVYERMRQNAKL